uniref:CENP-V/GFA domain-containing protein n=1 Tax=Pseudo-nitzschia delicatissima TaxID=44447 RepID=A0A7S0XLD0_9STRA|mmetsp:Transcript_320/g.681  ORF Transcript_320/g.681 Transcript_320/m.681 type:complete len:519 (+) Transcript_320:159-1715(+)
MSSKSSWYDEQSLVSVLPSASLVNATASASNNTEPPPASTSSSSSPYKLIVSMVGKGTGMSSIQAKRAVDFSAVTGSILLAWRITMYAYNTLRGDDKSDDEFSDDSTVVTKEPMAPRQRRTASYSILGIFRRTLRRIVLDETEYIARAPSANSLVTKDTNDEEKLVTHQGSCHCESIQFTVMAPSVMHARDGPGKIQFRHVSVKAANFQVYAGFDNLKTYYVAYRDSDDKGAHAFCERCGVHVLFAPSKASPNVCINVRCFRDDKNRKIKLTSKKDNISAGIPVAGQFDNVNSDQLSTISEVTQPFHFQMNSYNQNPPPNLDWTNRNNPIPRPAKYLSRKNSEVSSIASPVNSIGEQLEIPIKQFYAPSTAKTHVKNRRSTFSAGTASLTDAESSGSLYRGTLNSQRGLLGPMSPPRSGAASYGGMDDFSFTGDSVSLIDDNISYSSNSVTRRQSNMISLGRKSLLVNNGRENDMVAGNPPRHPTVTSPETRNQMKKFMSKYKKEKAKAAEKTKAESS